VRSLPAGWAFETARQGEADVTDRFLDAAPGTALAVDVVVTDRVTSIAGSVTTREGRPADDCSVVVFSADPERWTLGARAIAVAGTDERGAYSIAALPPGAYYAIALEYVDDGEEANPELLEWARLRAGRVDLVAGAPLKADLRLVRYEGGW
jgi:hypothetical protein